MNVLDCVYRIINAPNCGDEPPMVSITTLPGISLRALDMIANDDKLNYVGVIQSIIQRAFLRTISDLQALAGVELSNLDSTYCYGVLEEPRRIISINGATRFFELNIPPSKYFVATLLDISIFSARNNQNATIRIVDETLNRTIFTTNVLLNEGHNTIYINQDILNTRWNANLRFYIEGQLQLYNTHELPCTTDCDNGSLCYRCDPNQRTERRNMHGAGVSWLERCSFEKLVCAYPESFKSALLYASGIEFILESIGSPRANLFTTAKIEDLLKLQPIFEGYYKNALKNLSKNVNFCDECCFKCSGEVIYRYARP